MSGETLGHEQAAVLLPWLANGTLEGDELERVEQHMRGCVTCRREFAEQRALAALLRRQPPVQVSAELDFERLRRRLDAEGATGRLVPRRVVSTAVAAAVACAVVAMTFVLHRVEPAHPLYETLTEEVPDAALVDVVFADLDEARIREWLARHDAEIVAGPSERIGRYTLRFSGSEMAGAQMEELLQRFRSDARIRFAAPAYIEPRGDAVGTDREQP